MNKLLDDVKTYAQLLNSVARQKDGTGIKRPLTPVQCAYYIKRLIDENGESLEQVSERLGLGKPKNISDIYKKRDTTQVTSFLNLLKVSEKSRDLAGWGYEKYPKIPFSLIAQLSTMTSEEQDLIIQSTFTDSGKRVLGKEDVKKIRKWRNNNQNLPIADCLKNVLKLKPVSQITYLVVADIHDNLKKFTQGPNRETRLLTLLKNHIEGEFYHVTIGKSVLTISMDSVAYKTFRDSQYKRGVSYSNLLDQLTVS